MSSLAGTADIIDRHLGLQGGGLKRYATRTACHGLAGRPPGGFDAGTLLDNLLARIEQNCAASGRSPSVQNWRFEKKLHIAQHNTSAEKTLEKAIVARLSDDWVNQIPTSSGLVGSTQDRHRNIDLAFRHAPGRFELIELKITSDTPLYAAMELLEYAALYIYARRRLPASGSRRAALLSATTLHWRVLAPRPFYMPFDLGWLESALTTALRDAVARHLPDPLDMDFAFTWFAEDFVWPCETPPDLARALGQRGPVVWQHTRGKD